MPGFVSIWAYSGIYRIGDAHGSITPLIKLTCDDYLCIYSLRVSNRREWIHDTLADRTDPICRLLSVVRRRYAYISPSLRRALLDDLDDPGFSAGVHRICSDRSKK